MTHAAAADDRGNPIQSNPTTAPTTPYQIKCIQHTTQYPRTTTTSRRVEAGRTPLLRGRGAAGTKACTDTATSAATAATRHASAERLPSMAASLLYGWWGGLVGLSGCGVAVDRVGKSQKRASSAAFLVQVELAGAVVSKPGQKPPRTRCGLNAVQSLGTDAHCNPISWTFDRFLTSMGVEPRREMAGGRPDKTAPKQGGPAGARGWIQWL